MCFQSSRLVYCTVFRAVELQSTWKNPETGAQIPALRMIVVVRQTFSSVTCSLFTKESESYSAAAQITVDGETGSLSLDYTYTNRSKATIRHRSPIHDGAARLKIVISAPTRSCGPVRVLIYSLA